MFPKYVAVLIWAAHQENHFHAVKISIILRRRQPEIEAEMTSSSFSLSANKTQRRG